MPRSYGPTVDLVSRNRTYTFTERSLEGFPEAQAFLDGLTARGSLAMANVVLYVKLVAKLKRMGRLHQYDTLLPNRFERTAARAYWRWVRESYDARVRPVLAAFSNSDLRRGIQLLRISSIVPPSPDKKLYRRTLRMTHPGPGQAQQPDYVIDACPDKWTLHVPIDASTPWHNDPCIDQCDVVKIETPEQLEAVRIAIEKAWGHSDLSKLPRDAFLFGQPPIVEGVAQPDTDKHVVALADRHTKAGALVEAAGGSYATQPDIFATRLQGDQPADVIVIDFSATPYANAEAVLIAVHAAWSRWNETRGQSAKFPAAPALSRQKPPVPTGLWSDLPPPRPAGLAELPVEEHSRRVTAELPAVDLAHVTHFGAPAVPQAVQDTPSQPFIPTDWAAHDQVMHTTPVYCTACRQTHSVKPDDVPCADGAWTPIST